MQVGALFTKARPVFRALEIHFVSSERWNGSRSESGGLLA
jgi:hypothetical protein